MSYPGAPKYSKVEIEFKEKPGSKILNEVLNNKVENSKMFEDCGIMITGNHLLVIEDNSVNVPESSKFTKTSIFSLDDIEWYKIYNY